jgi:hypothetical protein
MCNGHSQLMSRPLPVVAINAQPFAPDKDGSLSDFRPS